MNDDLYPVDKLFGQRHTNYLTLPRSLLRSMPQGWQQQFVLLFQQLHEHFGNPELPDYKVRPVDRRGHYVQDPFGRYQHRVLEPEDVKALQDELDR